MKTPLQFVVINGDIVHRTATHLLQEAKNYFDQLPFPYYVTRGNHDAVSDLVWESVWGYTPNYIIARKDSSLLLLDTSNQAGEILCGDAVLVENMLGSADETLPVFVFMHIPYFRNTTVQECPEISKVLAGSNKVRAVFHGHDHSKDLAIRLGKQAILFDGHFGSSWGTPYRGYRIVEQKSSTEFSTYQFDLINQLRISESDF